MTQDIKRPAVLVFHLSEFFRTFGMLENELSQTVYNSPFYIYDQSFEGAGPKFEDEKEISDEDCEIGFSIIRKIWKEYIGVANTPCFKYIFKIIKYPESEDNYVGPIHGFAPGYDMDSAIETITKQNFTVIRWDEFWNENIILETEPESIGEFYKDGADKWQEVNLLIKADTIDYIDKTSFGGFPVKDRDMIFEWPKCDCGAELQYQGKIKTDLGFEMIFMQNCDDWGSNKVVIVDSENLEFVHPEEKQMALRKTQYGAKIVTLDADNYNMARECYPIRRRDILGQISGSPAWLQDEETPKCDCCGENMRFVAQLEEGPDYETAMNFGGGCGYLFDCVVGKTAKFITQC
jgi:hypothetical protein